MKTLRTILFFIIGALILSIFSTLQKLIAGFPIKLNGYFIPIIFGGIIGVTLGLLYQRLRNQRNNLIAINKDLIKAKDKAEENEKLKSAFLANVSH